MAGVIKDLKREVESPRRGDEDRFYDMMKMQHEERIEQLESAATDRETFLRELQKERDEHNKMMIDYQLKCDYGRCLYSYSRTRKAFSKSLTDLTAVSLSLSTSLIAFS